MCALGSLPGASHQRVGEAQRSRAQAGENSGEGRGVPAGTHRSVLAIALLRTWLSTGSKPETASHRGRCGKPVGGKAGALGASVRNGHRAEAGVGWIGPSLSGPREFMLQKWRCNWEGGSSFPS